jgi:hypothetical protein
MAASGKEGDINLNTVQTTVAGKHLAISNIVKNSNGMLSNSQNIADFKNGTFTKSQNRLVHF